jgi:hypothetical protein
MSNRLDQTHVAFGELIGGQSVLNQIEYCGSISGKPIKEVKITTAGELE